MIFKNAKIVDDSFQLIDADIAIDGDKIKDATDFFQWHLINYNLLIT